MLGLITRLFAILATLTCLQCRWNQPPPQDTIVFALGSEPKTLDPRFSTDANGQRMASLIFSSLVKMGPKLEVVGDLAQSWSYKDLNYNFKLKPGVQFHDGHPLTAQDLLFTVDEYRKSRSPFAAQFSLIDSASATYDFETGGQLVLKLKHFSASFINDLPSLRIIPKATALKAGDDFYAKPIGSGPFRYLSRDPKNFYLEKFENYFSDQAKTQNIQFKVVKDSTTRFQKMYKGQIDIIQSDIPFSKITVFKKTDKFNVVEQPGLSTAYILMNLRKPIFKDPKLRQAINSALDRNSVIEFVHEGYSEPAKSILTNANPYQNPNLKHKTLSKEQVLKIFSQYKEPIVLKTSNTQEAIANGRVITHQLQKAGLNVEQQTYEWGTYYEDVRSGKFDMAIMKWVGVSDPDIYRISLHSSMVPPGRNRGFYNNPQLDQLVDQAVREPNQDKRRSLYWKAQEVVFNDLPTIPLWYEKQVAITHKRVKNYDLPPNGDFSALVKVYK